MAELDLFAQSCYLSAMSTVEVLPQETSQKIPHGQRAAMIRKLHLRYPDLTPSELAKRVGVSRQGARSVLSTFLSNKTDGELRDFQESKADVYDALQLRILESVTAKKLANTSAPGLVTAAAILEDKSRLIRGMATGINVNVLMDVASMLRPKD